MLSIDFTQIQRRKKAYAGANGNKIAVVYEGEQYMLKFPSASRQNPDMSYSNSCFLTVEAVFIPRPMNGS